MQPLPPSRRASMVVSSAPAAAPSRKARRSASGDCYVALRPVRRQALEVPPSFIVDGRRVVFGDIRRVDSVVVLDAAKQRSTVKAVVEFELRQQGHAAIELVPRAKVVRVDGKPADPAGFKDVPDPANASSFRVVGVELATGKHTIEVEYELAAGVRYRGGSVEFCGRKFDLDDRMMDEQYFPTNLEYDQYPGSITFELHGTAVKHRVMTNGEVSEVDGKFVVRYPKHFNTASLFVNLIDPARFAIEEDVYQSHRGPVPITVYQATSGKRPNAADAAVSRAMDVAKTALAKHEGDFGPYPHRRLLVRLAENGGMEYAGATETSLGALPHELHHQWFARSAQPANGNAGWIDEAAASWHDKGYPRSTIPPQTPSKLSGFPPWHRITPRVAYSHGARLMAFLDGVFATRGGLLPVLSKFFATHKRRLFTTEMFLTFLTKEGRGLGFDFDACFEKQVYGAGLPLAKRSSHAHASAYARPRARVRR